MKTQIKTNKDGNISVEVVTITPELAEDFLKMNTKNRRSDPKMVETYAKAMKDGKWVLNGEPIIISNENVILDGQNRLIACTKAGVPFESLFVWGITPEAFKTIDIGKSRTPGDILYIDDVKNANVVAAAIARYFRLMIGQSIDTGSNKIPSGVRLSNFSRGKSDVLDFFRAHKGICTRVGEHIVSLGGLGRMVMNGSVIGGYELFLILEKNHPEERVRSFFEQLATGKNVENNTILLLRDALLKHNMKQKVLSGTQRSVYFAKTWNAFVTGRELKVLNYKAEREPMAGVLL